MINESENPLLECQGLNGADKRNLVKQLIHQWGVGGRKYSSSTGNHARGGRKQYLIRELWANK